MNELKTNLTNIQTQSAKTLEHTIKNFNDERVALISKIEQQKIDLNQKEKEIYNQTQSAIMKGATISSLEEKLLSHKTNHDEESKFISTKYEEAKKELNSKVEALMENKITFEKKLALSNQQNEFYIKRIEELNNQLDDLNKKFEDKSN